MVEKERGDEISRIVGVGVAKRRVIMRVGGGRRKLIAAKEGVDEGRQ